MDQLAEHRVPAPVDHGEDLHSPRSGVIFEDFEKQAISFGSDGKDPARKEREKREDQRKRSEAVVGS